MMGVSFAVKVPPASLNDFQRALQRTVALKGADPVKTVNKAAGYVASFAIASDKIPVANKQRIMDAMKMQVVKSSRRFRVTMRMSKTGKIKMVRRKVRPSKISNEWRGTLAAIIVSTINYRGSMGLLSKRYGRLVRKFLNGGSEYKKAANASQFYKVVEKFAKARANSAGYLRSGMFPSIRAFRVSKMEAAAKRSFKFPPGNAKAATKGTRIMASMEDYATGIDTVAPQALKKAEREVQALFEKWLREDLAQAAKTQGFKGSTP